MKLLKSPKNIFLILLALTSAVLCIVMPENLLKRESNQVAGLALDVPEEYYPTSSYYEVLKESSERLTDYQRRQLITGKWKSEISEVDEEYYESTGYHMETTAKEIISNLNHIGAYPVVIDSSYNQWYNWKCTYMQALDSNFRSYAGFFWKVVFTHYENGETLTVYMTQDGLPVKLLYDAGETIGTEENKTEDSSENNTKKWTTDEFKKLAYLMFGSYVYGNVVDSSYAPNSILILESTGTVSGQSNVISNIKFIGAEDGDAQVVYYKGKMDDIDSNEVIQIKIGMNGIIGINDIRSISEDEERGLVDYLMHDKLSGNAGQESILENEDEEPMISPEIKAEYLNARMITVIRSEGTSSEKSENQYYIYIYDEDGKYMVGLVPVE